MYYLELQKKLKQTPFQPFRLCLTDGVSYEIRHPEMLFLGKRGCVVGIAENPEDTAYDWSVDIDLLHVIRTEPLEAPAPKQAPPGTNGEIT